ncbi:MAG: polysaccharide biosynthesis/export family protein [Acidobacteriia bacterium]|nr:polysaccharide biosynthesis/export family protein [Terriglobia bacterium]
METPQQTNDRIRAFANLVQKNQREYTVGPADLLSVDVFDVKELSGDFRVTQAGSLALPLLPVRLQVSGLTESQVEKKIAEMLEANGLVSHPQVSVVAKEKRSKPIMVVGSVVHPMVYHADRPVTLLEVLSEAGGISNDAGGTVIVTRAPQQSLALVPVAPVFPEWKEPAASSAPSSTVSDSVRATGPDPSLPSAPTPGPSAPLAQNPPPSAVPAEASNVSSAAPSPSSVPENTADPSSASGGTVTIRLDDLLEKADPQSNIILEGGDVVSVPRGGIVYVLGAVSRTGAYVLASDNTQMSILKVLSLAGGLQRSAKGSAAVILRKDEKGLQQQVRVDLGKIMARKTEDVPLSPNDILFVPESGGKRTAIRLAEIAIGVGSAAAVFRIAR